jgi:hypothetical protein
MEVVKVKIPVGKNGLYQKFLANPWGKKGVGCASGCIKIVLDDNMMDQIRSFKASRNHLNQDIIPVDIIPGKTDPYLIVDKSGDIFWVGGVDPTKLWTPERNTKGQYTEIKRKDGTIKSYKLDVQLGEIVSPDSYTDFDRAEIVSNPGKSEEEEEWRGYPEIPSRQSSLKWIQKDDDVAKRMGEKEDELFAKRMGEKEDELFAKRMGEKEDELFAIELQRKFDDIDATGNIRITKKKKRRHKKRDKKPKRKPTRKRVKKKPTRKRVKKKPTRKREKKKAVRKRGKKKSAKKRGKKKN